MNKAFHLPPEVVAHRQEKTCVVCGKPMQIMSDMTHDRHPQCQPPGGREKL